MPEITIPIVFPEDTSGLSKAAAEISKLKTEVKDLHSVQQKALADGAKSMDEFGQSINEAGTEMADFDTLTQEATQSGSGFKSVVRENIRGLTLFGHNLGGVIDNLRAKQVALRGVVSGLGATSGALKVLRVALISTGIGALIVALGSLIVFLTKTEVGANKLSQAMAGLGASANVVIKKIATVGESVSKTLEEFAKAHPVAEQLNTDFGNITRYGIILGSTMEALKFIFSGLVTEMGEAADKAIQLEESTQKLADAERAFGVEASKRRAEIEKNREIADDELNTFKERIPALKSAAAVEQKIFEDRIKFAQQELFLITENNKESLKPDKDAQAAAEIKVNELRADAAKQQRLDLNKLEALQRQQLKTIKQLADEERKREEQRLKIEEKNRQVFADLQKNLAQQITDEEQLTKTEQERLEFQRQNAIESLNLAEQELIARAKFLGQEEEISKIQTDFARLRALTNERYEKEITKVTVEEIKKRDDAFEQSLDENAALLKNKRDKRIEFLEKEREIDELRIDQIEKSGNDELTLEQFKEDAKLRLLKNFLEKKRQTLIDNPLGLGFDDLEIEKLGLEIEKVDSELKKLETLSVFDRIKTKFKTLFNLSDEDLKEIGDQLASTVGNIFDGLSALNDAELTRQQQIVDARQEAVDKLQEQLDEELRLKEEGVANNSDLLKTQLETQTELLRKEEEKRLALEKKAAQLRLRQNALEIASNIALSVAKAIEANAKFGLVGVVTAAAQIASIFALIAKARAQAAQFEVPKLRKGARLSGATHENNGIDLVVSDASGGRQLYEAEKDEWLIGTQPSKEHDGFLERLNGNEFAGRNLNRDVDFSNDFFSDPKGMIQNLAPNFGMVAMPDVIGQMLPRIRETVKAGQIAKHEMEKALMVDAFEATFSKMGAGFAAVERAIKEQPLAIPITESGYLIKEKKGNTTTVSIHEAPKRRNKA